MLNFTTIELCHENHSAPKFEKNSNFLYAQKYVHSESENAIIRFFRASTFMACFYYYYSTGRKILLIPYLHQTYLKKLGMKNNNIPYSIFFQELL